MPSEQNIEPPENSEGAPALLLAGGPSDEPDDDVDDDADVEVEVDLDRMAEFDGPDA